MSMEKFIIEDLQRLATEHEDGKENLDNSAKQTTQKYQGTRLHLEGPGMPMELHFMKMYFQKNGNPAVEVHEDPGVPYASQTRIEGDSFESYAMKQGTLKRHLEEQEYEFTEQSKDLLKTLLFGYRK